MPNRAMARTMRRMVARGIIIRFYLFKQFGILIRRHPTKPKSNNRRGVYFTAVRLHFKYPHRVKLVVPLNAEFFSGKFIDKASSALYGPVVVGPSPTVNHNAKHYILRTKPGVSATVWEKGLYALV